MGAYRRKRASAAFSRWRSPLPIRSSTKLARPLIVRLREERIGVFAAEGLPQNSRETGNARVICLKWKGGGISGTARRQLNEIWGLAQHTSFALKPGIGLECRALGSVMTRYDNPALMHTMTARKSTPRARRSAISESIGHQSARRKPRSTETHSA